MTLDSDGCWARLADARHGVLGTAHSRRGVDAVPVVFVLDGRSIIIPVDTVKPKRGSRLQRLANLRLDDRCVLLVEEYHDDWSRLWWVRVHARAVLGGEGDGPGAAGEDVLARFAERFPAYRAAGSIAGVVTLTPSEITGWAAAGLTGS